MRVQCYWGGYSIPAECSLLANQYKQTSLTHPHHPLVFLSITSWLIGTLVSIGESYIVRVREPGRATVLSFREPTNFCHCVAHSAWWFTPFDAEQYLVCQHSYADLRKTKAHTNVRYPTQSNNVILTKKLSRGLFTRSMHQQTAKFHLFLELSHHR